MYLTVHAAAGGAIGQWVNQPWLAFVIGFASHLVLDMIPHGDEGISSWTWFKTERARIVAAGMIDLVLMVVMLVIWIKYSGYGQISQLPGMIAGTAGAVAPDALWGFQELTGAPLLRQYRAWHQKTHNIIKTKLTTNQGFLLQIPLLVILTWIILML